MNSRIKLNRHQQGKLRDHAKQATNARALLKELDMSVTLEKQQTIRSAAKPQMSCYELTHEIHLPDKA